MDSIRRFTLKAVGVAAVFGAGLMRPISAFAASWNKGAFDSKDVAGAIKGLGVSGTSQSDAIVIEAPQIAENGAVVPIEVTSNIPGTQSIAVLIEKNPFPLAGQFEFMDGALPYVKVNVKMGESSNVRVVAQAGGKHYTAVREIKVTIGGCGG